MAGTKGNVKSENRISSIISDNEYPGSNEEPFGFGPGEQVESGGAGGGSELHSPGSPGSSGDTAMLGSNEAGTAPRKRGRKPGSVSAKQSGSGTGIRRGELRRKLAVAGTGFTQFAFQAVGYFRASRYRQANVPLANAVFQCYQIQEEDAKKIGEPLGETLAEYLPDKWLETVNAGVDPAQCAMNLFLIVKMCMDNEKAVVAQFQERLVHPKPNKPVVGETENAGSPSMDIPQETVTPPGSEELAEVMAIANDI